MKAIGRVVGAGFAAGLLFGASAAMALHKADPRTRNMIPLGDQVDVADFLGIKTGNPNIHTDLAFQGKFAYQGNWNGFRILNIKNKNKPKLVSFTRCDGDQGDVSVWKNILVRSTNSANPGGRECGGTPVPAGFEGLHIFDIKNKKAPKLIATVPIAFGSHTHTLVPDTGNGRILIYNSTSSGNTKAFNIIEIPLSDPASASEIGQAALVGDGVDDCHDISVFTADVNLAVCAGDSESPVFDISDPANPVQLYTLAVPGVGDGTPLLPTDPNNPPDNVGWHSGTFSWDGEIIVITGEPGGGVAPECQTVDANTKKTAFFFDARTGAPLGGWLLPRPQDGDPAISLNETCTLHNYNTAPLRTGRRILVMGNYHAGTNAVDFTDPNNPVEFAWSDPPPSPDPVIAGGAWSSYWYNGLVYETNIDEGLNIFRIRDRRVRGTIKFARINPQTQTCRIPLGGGRGGDDDDDDDDDDDGGGGSRFLCVSADDDDDDDDD